MSILRKFYFLSFFLCTSNIYTQVISINEFMASNVTIYPEMYDFDDYSDWIELYNPGSEPYTMNGFFLTDDFNDPLKWEIPDNTIIGPDDYLIVWADNYDEQPNQTYTRPYWPWDNYTTRHFHTNFKLSKAGEEIGLYKVGEEQNYILIEQGSLWKYLDNGSNQNFAWKEIQYNDETWSVGNAELGYGDGDEETLVNFGPDEDNKYITTYFRNSFYLDSLQEIQRLAIRLKRDDGAVVYLNGNEIIRSNMPEGQIDFDTYAVSGVNGSNEDNFFESIISSNDLVNGQNLLAVELHQVNRTSSDISFDLELIGIGYAEIILIDSIIFDEQITDISYGKNSDNSTWNFFGHPTPGQVNNSIPSTNLIHSEMVNISLASGFYNSSQNVELSTNSNEGQIYFTLDGSRPNSNSNVYFGPLNIDTTTVLRTISLQESKLPSEINIATYFISEQTELVTISLVADPATLWDENIGIYANEYKQREIPISIQYFTPETGYSFTAHAGARLGGLNIWTKPQKPFTIYTRGRFGQDVINYQLFENKQIADFSRIVFRNGGDDWEETLIRDPMTESIIMDMMVCGYMAYRPSALFLNGEYWGIYNIREKFDTRYFSENFDVDPDNLDHLEYTQVPSIIPFLPRVELMVVEGDMNHYNTMIDYILNNNLNETTHYEQIEAWMNVDSFIDHLIMTIYCANTSWGHNREWWRPREENGKWQWLIVDVDRGFNLSNISSNLLDDLIDDYELFNYLLDSELFRNRFIQRSAAHLSNTFFPDRINTIVDSLSNAIYQEMPKHITRWGDEGGINSMDYWQNELDKIKQFSSTRNARVYNQFINELELDGSIQLTTIVEPMGSGKIMINDIPMISENGEGIFFKNIPISLLAIPASGYEFIGWAGITDSNRLEYNCSIDSSFTAVFQLSEESILPDIITLDTTLYSEQPYVVTNDLIIEEGATLTLNEGVEIRMPDNGNIIVNGKLVIHGIEGLPVEIKSNNNEANRWGAICFNNEIDTSAISYLKLSGASTGIDPVLHRGAISGINSNIILDNVIINDVIFPIYLEGGNSIIRNSSITCDYICDFINVKGGQTLIENCEFFGSTQPNTDAIDLDNVTYGEVKNNRIYNFRGVNSDGLDIGENSINVHISENLIYHSSDKGISVGQGSEIIVTKNLIVGCSKAIAVKDNSQAIVQNNTFANNDTTIHCYEKNLGAGGGIAIITNSIFYKSNALSFYNDELSEISIDYSLSDMEIIEGQGNLLLDPLFIEPEIYDFELSDNSPCIDNGNPNDDLDPNGSYIDMGAYYIYDLNDYPFEIEISDKDYLKINEFLAINESTNMDDEGEYDDWIELYNQSDSSIDLSGLYLSDDFNNKIKWKFPNENILIEGGDYLLIWCDNNEEQGLLHTNFKISAEGEGLFLVDNNGVTILDHIIFGEQSSDLSYGRITDGSNTWAFMNPTPGSMNSELNIKSSNNIPDKFVLYQNYPNPFNPITTLRYDLPEDALVYLTIYDIMGREIKKLVSSRQVANRRAIQWDATNNKGQTVSAGVYLYTIQANQFIQTKKMILLK